MSQDADTSKATKKVKLENLIATVWKNPRPPNVIVTPDSAPNENFFISFGIILSSPHSTPAMLWPTAYLQYIKILTWLEAFWSFLYIWFGFHCAQVSSGNCETMEWKKFAIFILTLKPWSNVRIFIYQTETWAIKDSFPAILLKI